MRISGVSKPEICVRLGWVIGRMLAPENVLRMLVESFETLGVIERVFGAMGGDNALGRSTDASGRAQLSSFAANTGGTGALAYRSRATAASMIGVRCRSAFECSPCMFFRWRSTSS